MLCTFPHQLFIPASPLTCPYVHSSVTFREHSKYEWNTPLLSPEMSVTFLTHFRASIYPAKDSLSLLRAVFFSFTSSVFIQNSHLRDAQCHQVFYCQRQECRDEHKKTKQNKTSLHFRIRILFKYTYTYKVSLLFLIALTSQNNFQEDWNWHTRTTSWTNM